jgi:hypothetical protein
MVEYPCPFCGKSVKLMQLGEGWVGMCCKQIVYNSRMLPGTTLVDNVETAEEKISLQSG